MRWTSILSLYIGLVFIRHDKDSLKHSWDSLHGLRRQFRSHFDLVTNKALIACVRDSFVEGCTYGLASAPICLAEALLFYVGAVLIARGT